MREIKFRAWDLEKKVMCVPRVQCNFNSGCYDINSLFDEHSKEFVWQQFTGLYANGKEIYEGDVVDVAGEICQIKYVAPSFAAFNRRNHEWNIIYALSEIIGNIYENPELL
jgi:YopX protein